MTPAATPPDPRTDAAPAATALTRARMQREGYRFEFFQAVRLLAASRGGPHTVGGPNPRREAVRISPDVASVFPAADIRHVHPPATPDAPTDVEVGFGGLYGVDAALPTTFHDRVTTAPVEARPLRDFLDLVGHRPYAQLWRAWARYRPEVRPPAPAGVRLPDAHARRAVALAGISTEARALLPLAARLAAWSRNAEGLAALLTHATGERSHVTENVPRLVRLGERPRLGRARLGVDAVVGARVRDESGKIRLTFGPLTLGAYRDLLPGAPGAARVDALVRAYATDWLDYDVDLLLHTPETPPLRLGDRQSARLGHTAILGTPPLPVVRRRVHYPPSLP